MLFIGVLWWDIFDSLYLYNLIWFLCLFILLKKKSEISIIKACFHQFPIHYQYLKNHRFRNIIYPSLRLRCYGGPHVIKVEIKRTKMIFFAFISIQFSVGTVWLHMYCKSMSWRNWSCTSYWGDVTFAYVELLITRSIFAIPLDFEIARLTCIYFCLLNLKLNFCIGPNSSYKQNTFYG